jgi:iron(III) transport system ATP-binding protein
MFSKYFLDDAQLPRLRLDAIYSLMSRLRGSRKVMEDASSYLSTKNLSKFFGEFLALDNVSIDINAGEFVCFLGPSGCGKTTLLRCIAGLEVQSSGTIIQNSEIISGLPTSQRDFGIVFQSYALFPNLSCFQNISYGLENLGWDKKDVTKRVEELLSLVGLSDHTGKYPSQLSGGEQQRIALARAIATSPNLLLLDEPLSALDAKVRVHLRQELKNFHRRLGLTTVMVTHDQEEALAIADRIFVMDSGKIMQFGTPEDIYANSRNPFVANFIGMTNFIEGKVLNKNVIEIDNKQLDFIGHGFSKGTKVLVAARPECIQLSEKSGKNIFDGTVVDVEFLGSFLRIYLQTSIMPNQRLIVDKPMIGDFDKSTSIGDVLGFTMSPTYLNVYECDK